MVPGVGVRKDERGGLLDWQSAGAADRIRGDAGVNLLRLKLSGAGGIALGCSLVCLWSASRFTGDDADAMP